MKVSLATGGGQAAGIRLPPKVVDANSLSEAAASELALLVAAAKSAPAPKEARPGSLRDAMTYLITIENDDPPVVLTQSDITMSVALIALRDWIRKHSIAK
jgi:hypothetical protein